MIIIEPVQYLEVCRSRSRFCVFRDVFSKMLLNVRNEKNAKGTSKTHADGF